jgi:hypothetical protein
MAMAALWRHERVRQRIDEDLRGSIPEGAAAPLKTRFLQPVQSGSIYHASPQAQERRVLWRKRDMSSVV